MTLIRNRKPKLKLKLSRLHMGQKGNVHLIDKEKKKKIVGIIICLQCKYTKIKHDVNSLVISKRRLCTCTLYEICFCLLPNQFISLAVCETVLKYLITNRKIP